MDNNVSTSADRYSTLEGVLERIVFFNEENGFTVARLQVAQKWLKDRKGRTLTYDELTHYQKIIVALKETIRLMEEVDDLIPEWPVE